MPRKHLLPDLAGRSGVRILLVGRIPGSYDSRGLDYLEGPRTCRQDDSLKCLEVLSLDGNEWGGDGKRWGRWMLMKCGNDAIRCEDAECFGTGVMIP